MPIIATASRAKADIQHIWAWLPFRAKQASLRKTESKRSAAKPVEARGEYANQLFGPGHRHWIHGRSRPAHERDPTLRHHDDDLYIGHQRPFGRPRCSGRPDADVRIHR